MKQFTEQDRQAEDNENDERGRKVMILCCIFFVVGNIGLVLFLIKLLTR